MEFEILNDILNSTVSSLFPNTAKHLSYFRFDDDGTNPKINDIPKSSTRRDEKDKDLISPPNSDNLENAPVKGQLKQLSNNANSSVNPEQWKISQGKKKLEDAMKRLNIDEQRIRNKNLTNFGLDFLTAEKSKVKSELKKYDNDFNEIFKRMPNRSEKEVMKPLYVYYKNLKTSIAQKQSAGGSSSSNSSSTAVGTAVGSTSGNAGESAKSGAGNTNTNIKVDNNTLLTNNYTAAKKKEPAYSIQGNSQINSQVAASSTNNNSIYSFNNIYNLESTSATISVTAINDQPLITKEDKKVAPSSYTNLLINKEPTITSSNSNSNSNPNISSKDPKKNIATITTTITTNDKDKEFDLFSNVISNSQNDKVGTNNKRITSSGSSKGKKLTKTEVVQLEKEYESLKKDQNDLKQRLHNYQKDFYEIHNRKVKYYKDIIPVENEYNKYKENKIRMKEIQDTLSQNKKDK